MFSLYLGMMFALYLDAQGHFCTLIQLPGKDAPINYASLHEDICPLFKLMGRHSPITGTSFGHGGVWERRGAVALNHHSFVMWVILSCHSWSFPCKTLVSP